MGWFLYDMEDFRHESINIAESLEIYSGLKVLVYRASERPKWASKMDC